MMHDNEQKDVSFTKIIDFRMQVSLITYLNFVQTKPT